MDDLVRVRNRLPAVPGGPTADPAFALNSDGSDDQGDKARLSSRIARNVRGMPLVGLALPRPGSTRMRRHTSPIRSRSNSPSRRSLPPRGGSGKGGNRIRLDEGLGNHCVWSVGGGGFVKIPLLPARKISPRTSRVTRASRSRSSSGLGIDSVKVSTEKKVNGISGGQEQTKVALNTESEVSGAQPSANLIWDLLMEENGDQKGSNDRKTLLEHVQDGKPKMGRFRAPGQSNPNISIKQRDVHLEDPAPRKEVASRKASRPPPKIVGCGNDSVGTEGLASEAGRLPYTGSLSSLSSTLPRSAKGTDTAADNSAGDSGSIRGGRSGTWPSPSAQHTEVLRSRAPDNLPVKQTSPPPQQPQQPQRSLLPTGMSVRRPWVDLNELQKTDPSLADRIRTRKEESVIASPFNNRQTGPNVAPWAWVDLNLLEMTDPAEAERIRARLDDKSPLSQLNRPSSCNSLPQRYIQGEPREL